MAATQIDEARVEAVVTYYAKYLYASEVTATTVRTAVNTAKTSDPDEVRRLYLGNSNQEAARQIYGWTGAGALTFLYILLRYLDVRLKNPEGQKYRGYLTRYNRGAG